MPRVSEESLGKKKGGVGRVGLSGRIWGFLILWDGNLVNSLKVVKGLFLWRFPLIYLGVW